MRTITIKLPEELVESIDELVAVGRFKSRSELVRKALEEIIKKELLFPGFIREDEKTAVRI